MEQRLEAFLAAVAGALDAAERQLHAAPGAEIIDEDLAGFERLGEAELAAAIIRPDAGDETIRRGVGEVESFGLVAKAHGDENGAEYLLLPQSMVGRDVADHRRGDVEPIGRRVRRDAALAEELETRAPAQVELGIDVSLLRGADHESAMQIQ